MARFRLRFLLQEVDLPSGETIIGRSAVCHVTIEDPLVSRQHARILVQGGKATVEDLGSRNGLIINGRQMSGVVELCDNDRLRIGTQELVFSVVPAPANKRTGPGTRATGFMCHCAGCGLPYPEEAPNCPSCGSRERMDEETVSGVVGEGKNWNLELLIGVACKAASLRRWDDVERALRRARNYIDERLARDERVSRDQLDELADAIAALVLVRSNAQWGEWVLGVYAALGFPPKAGVSNRLSSLPPEVRESLAPAADRLVASIRGRGDVEPEDSDLLETFSEAIRPSSGPSL